MQSSRRKSVISRKLSGSGIFPTASRKDSRRVLLAGMTNPLSLYRDPYSIPDDSAVFCLYRNTTQRQLFLPDGAVHLLPFDRCLEAFLKLHSRSKAEKLPAPFDMRLNVSVPVRSGQECMRYCFCRNGKTP